MKRQIIAAAMLSALLLTACGADSTAAESQKPESPAAAESSAEESSAKADESTEKAAESAIEAEPAAEKKAEQVSFETPVAGIKLGMKIGEIRGVLGSEAKHDTELANPLLAEWYDFDADSVTVFGTEFQIPCYITCYLDVNGYLSQCSVTLGKHHDSSSSVYSDAAAQQADKEKLLKLVCAHEGEPVKTEEGFVGDDTQYTWYSSNNTEIYLTGSAALWGIEGETVNLLSTSCADTDGNQRTYSEAAGIAVRSDDSSSKSSGGKKKSSDSLAEGEYWCCGKNDTCKNKTYSPTDLYCHSCDPDDNNIEGDQRKSSGSSKKGSGEIKDTNGNGKVDEDDWEKAWKDYLNEHMN